VGPSSYSERKPRRERAIKKISTGAKGNEQSGFLQKAQSDALCIISVLFFCKLRKKGKEKDRGKQIF
jgi:hypothetical protein